MKPYQSTIEELQKQLGISDLRSGLSKDDARKRLEQYGPNLLRQTKPKSLLLIWINQFKSFVVLLLVIAAGISFLFSEYTEGISIIVVILLNALIGFFTELQATRSMEALHKLGRVKTRVRRSSKIIEVLADELVPGDIVVLEAGDIVTADMRILEASKVQCDESLLTGESIPVSKSNTTISLEVTLDARTNMLFKGTSVTRGSAEAIVISTGMNTELGSIAKLVDQASEETTPLEKRLGLLGQSLVGAILVIVAIVFLVGLLKGQELTIVVQMVIALAVAAIPEGLPIVATIALSHGILRMAKHKALVRKLAAVETLGSTSIIISDKTGTLTHNKMSVVQLELIDDLDTTKQEVLEISVLCNNAFYENGEGIGDAMEVALLNYAQQQNFERDSLLRKFPEIKEVAFDSDTRMMATYHNLESHLLVAVKGAPEEILLSSNLDHIEKERWRKKSQNLANQGYRLLAIASKTVNDTDAPPYENLKFLGLIVFLDPPRKEVIPAIQQCKRSGIHIIMATGDHPATAVTIANQVQLVENNQESVITGDQLDFSKDLTGINVFARVSPAQKLQLIEYYQKTGAIVGMIGDGVNDAPALKKADIGISMGIRGTQVAHEASDIVLKDDSFPTIIYAIQQGRVIFSNIRKFIFYLLSCNLAEISLVLIASLLTEHLPILPIQILFLNLVTDVFPALALGVGSGGTHVLNKNPRDPKESFLQANHWVRIILFGILIGGSVLFAFLLSLNQFDYSVAQSTTIAFLTLAIAQLFHIFNMIDIRSSIWNNGITRNPFVWAALGLCSGIMIVSIKVPTISNVLNVVDIPFNAWMLVLLFSFLPLFIGTIVRKSILFFSAKSHI